MVEDLREIDVPGLERLMRSVLKSFLMSHLGAEWPSGLSARTQGLIARAASTARRERPSEQLSEDWDAAGIREIAAVLESLVPTSFTDGELGVWEGQEYRMVDLARIRAFRGKQLHAVGRPHDAHVLSEVGGTVLRLRTQFEALRRRLAGDESEWWPYIEAIHSNVPEFEWIRGQAMQEEVPLLSEGDLIELDVRAVHPSRGQGELRYALGAGVGPRTIGFPFRPTLPWTHDHHLALEALAGRGFKLAVFVADSGNTQDTAGSGDDEAHFRADVLPARFMDGRSR